MPTDQIPLTTIERHSTGHIGVFRLAATLGIAAGLIFILCWAGTFIAFASPTHAYVGLFTDAETQSILALIQGIVWSLLFGILSGGLIGSLFNLFASLDRR